MFSHGGDEAADNSYHVRLVFNSVHSLAPPRYMCHQVHADQLVCLDQLLNFCQHLVSGQTHLLTVVDRTTRWAETIPLQSTTVQVVADSFVANWVAHFGVLLKR